MSWQIFICQKHRRFTEWYVPGNLRRLEADEEPLPCGTVHDYRPHTEIVVSYLHGWMGGGGWPSDGPPVPDDDWLGQLRLAQNHFAYIRAEDLLAIVVRVRHLAESDAMDDIIMLLANAETAEARQRAL